MKVRSTRGVFSPSFSSSSSSILGTTGTWTIRVRLCAILATLLLHHTAQAKTASGAFQLSGANTEHVLTKFALSAGTSKAHFNVTFRSVDMYVDERNLRVRLYNDEDWYQYQYKSPTCQQKVKLARKSIPVVWNAVRRDESTSEFYAKKKKKGQQEDQWEARVESPVKVEVQRNQYWYFVMDDCSLELYGHDEAAPAMTYKLQVWDAPLVVTMGGQVEAQEPTHLPADEEGMVTLHWMSLGFSALLALWLVLRTILPALTSSRGAHVAPMVVVLASLANAASSACELLHLKIYERNGIGSYTCDALAAHLEALSDALVALLLLCLGSGWTLPADVVRSGGGGGSGGLLSWIRACQAPAASSSSRVFFVLLLGVHAALAQWGRTFDDDFDVYHSLEHLPGRVLLLLRATLALGFLAGVASVRHSGKCPPSLQQWLWKFALVGLSWFVSLPFVAAVCASLPYIQRHPAMSMGAAAVQAVSLTSLAWLLGGGAGTAATPSAYHAISRAAAGGGGGGSNNASGSGGDLTDLTAASSSKSQTKQVWTWGKTKIRLD